MRRNGPSNKGGRPTPRRVFLTGAAALTGTAAFASRAGAVGPEAPASAAEPAGTASSTTFLRGDQVWSDTLTGGLRVTGATGPDMALDVGNGTRSARLWSAGDELHLSTSDRSPIQVATQVRWDSDDSAQPGGSGFSINRPATVWRQTGEKHKGALIEFQQWLDAGPHPYGIACTSVGRTFDVAAAGHTRVRWILAHYDSPTAEPRPLHQHMNFETCKADLSTLITRFQISWGEDVPLCSFPTAT